MKKRKKNVFLIVIICILLVLGVMIILRNRKEVNDAPKPNKPIEMTEEEKIWKDSESDDIYKLRLFLRDSMQTFVNKPIMFGDDVESLEQLSSNNLFAKKILELYTSSTIPNILKEGTDLEKSLLYTYLSIMTNHYEGMGYYLSKVSKDNYMNLDGYHISQIYYKGIDDNEKFIPTKLQSYGPDYLFVFSNYNGEGEPKPENYIYVFTDGYFSDEYYTKYNASSSLELEFYKGSDTNKLLDLLSDKYNGSIKNFGKELSQDRIKEIIYDNNEFLDFYLKYKKDVFYPRWELENVKIPNTNQKETPRVGMTRDEVRKSLWGSPDKINKDTYAWGTKEQWVYRDYGYVYFENGIVTVVSER